MSRPKYRLLLLPVLLVLLLPDPPSGDAAASDTGVFFGPARLSWPEVGTALADATPYGHLPGQGQSIRRALTADAGGIHVVLVESNYRESQGQDRHPLLLELCRRPEIHCLALHQAGSFDRFAQRTSAERIHQEAIPNFLTDDRVVADLLAEFWEPATRRSVSLVFQADGALWAGAQGRLAEVEREAISLVQALMAETTTPAAPPADRALDAFRLYSLQTDRNVSLREILEAHEGPVVLNFWATWCLPCLEEIPLLESYTERYPEVHIVGVANANVSSDTIRDIRATLRKHGAGYPQYIAPTYDLQRTTVGNEEIPAFVVFNGNGALLGRVGSILEPGNQRILESHLLALTENPESR